MTFIMKKKKYKFNVNITIEELSSVPYINSVLFAKCRLLQGGTFTQSTDRREVENCSVKWNKGFVFTFKTTANASTGLLDSCFLRVSLRKEIKGGKSFIKLGYADVNLSSLAGAGSTRGKCLLEGYESKGSHRQDNSMLMFVADIKLLSGDPCFKTPKTTIMTERTATSQPTDIFSESELGVAKPLAPLGPEPLGLADGLLDENVINCPMDTTSQPQPLQSLPGQHHPQHHHHSNHHTTLSTNGSGTMLSNGLNLYDQMTSSATSFTNSVGSSAYDNFETANHSRSNSSQTSSSRISTGFNSLPSHSRQGSADSEVTSRHPPASDIKFNSVDRVGKRLPVERTVKPVNGSDELAKKAIDSTRVPADQLVHELFETNKLVDPSSNEHHFINDSNGGLQLFVSKDGSATIGTRQQRPDATFAVRTNSASRTHRN